MDSNWEGIKNKIGNLKGLSQIAEAVFLFIIRKFEKQKIHNAK